MWVEREGQFGNGERRTAVFEKAVDPPGEAKWDLWMLMEVAKRVLDGEKIDGKDAFDVLFGEWYDKDAADFKGDQREVSRAIWEEYRTFSNPSLNDKRGGHQQRRGRHVRREAEDGGQAAGPLRPVHREPRPHLARARSGREVAAHALALLRRPAGRRLRPDGRGAVRKAGPRARPELLQVGQRQAVRGVPPLRAAGRRARRRVPLLLLHRAPAGALAHGHHDPARARARPRAARGAAEHEPRATARSWAWPTATWRT